MTFPLGEPINRKPVPDWTPIANRPGWWKDRKGTEKYIEPPRPVPTIWELFNAHRGKT